MMKKLASIMRWIRNAKIVNRRTCKLVIALILVIWITNPKSIPLLPQSIKERLSQVAEGMWGNVETIKDVLPISWVIFFQIIVMAIFLVLILEILKSILSYGCCRVLICCDYYIRFLVECKPYSVFKVRLCRLGCALLTLPILARYRECVKHDIVIS